MIRVTDLVKIYPTGSVKAVDGVSFEVEEGSFYTLLGPSGCGKTTTLRCIAGLERADGGSIALGDITVVSDRIFVPPHERDIGMVFQNYAIWPHMTVFENVAFPLRVVSHRHRIRGVQQRVEEALTLVGLEAYQKRMATQLSGGQQQRLSLARAIVREPKVLLLDEPLSNLDAKLRERMRGELLVIQKRLGVTTLFVTHDQVEALSMSDHVAVMDDGKIVQQGTPEDIYHRPANEFVANFIGSTNLFMGELLPESDPPGGCRVKTDIGTLTCDAGSLDLPGSSVMMAIRPEDVVIHSDEGRPIDKPNLFKGRVQIALFTGTSIEYYVDVGDALLQVRAGPRGRLSRGESIVMEIPPEACLTFSVEGKSRVQLEDRRLPAAAQFDDRGGGKAMIVDQENP